MSLLKAVYMTPHKFVYLLSYSFNCKEERNRMLVIDSTI